MNDLIAIKDDSHAAFLIAEAVRLEARAADLKIIAGTDKARYQPAMASARVLLRKASRYRQSVDVWRTK